MRPRPGPPWAARWRESVAHLQGQLSAEQTKAFAPKPRAGNTDLGKVPLAELGDGRSRFADARAVKAYAGSAPATRASGRSISITHRKVKNHRLCAAGFIWAFMAITNHPPARAHYDRRRDQGDRHAAALRHLFNRLIGQLHHCLQTGRPYDPAKAFAPPKPAAA